MIMFNFVNGQLGTIQDIDGWTNVRDEPSLNSKSIYKINEGEIFWFDTEHEDNDSNWIKIYIPKDKYSKHGYSGKFSTGYIHRSRFIELTKLKTYEGKEFEFEYFVSDFDSTGRKLVIENNGYPRLENEAQTWGTDGYLPYNQLDSIKISLDNKRLEVKPELYNDLFNIRKKVTIYQLQNFFIVHNQNSDGAGFYELAWLIDNEGIKLRIAGTMY